MKRIFILLAYFIFSSGTGSTEDIVDVAVKEGRKQLAVYSQRAAAAIVDNRCYRCGVCCKDKPCRFGEWDSDHRQCAYLTMDVKAPTYTTYLCGKYDDIIRQDQGKALAVFGNGCSNSICNQVRERNRREMKKDELRKLDSVCKPILHEA